MLTLLLLTVFSPALFADDFIRGDSDPTGGLSIVDVVVTLNYIVGTGDLPCLDAADSNDDGSIDVVDPVYLLAFLFAGSDAPPAPAVCGSDPTADLLDCNEYSLCP